MAKKKCEFKALVRKDKRDPRLTGSGLYKCINFLKAPEDISGPESYVCRMITNWNEIQVLAILKVRNET